MIVVDLETSGVNPNKHSVLSIGAVDFLDPSREFYRECRIWEGAHIMDEALEVNGFSLDEINDPDKLLEKEAVKEFFSWASESENHTVAGQNPSFDLFFLQSAAQRGKLNFPLAHRTVDLHSVCLSHMIWSEESPPTEKGRTALNSDKIMEYVGLPAEPRPHIALNGAKWEAEAFSRLFYGKPFFPEFENFKIPWVK